MKTRDITRRIAELLTRLKLKGWHIRYHTFEERETLAHSDHYAEVFWYDHVPEAFMYLCTKRPDDEVDFSIRHEVAHVRLRELDCLACKVFSQLGEGAATEALKSAWGDALERACNGIAEALANK